MNTMDKFRAIYNNPYERAKTWKKAGKKVVGCLPMYFPEEILHAAGILPVTILGNNKPITLADKHLMTNSCQQLRSTFNSLLAGEYDFLDGVAALHVCDQVRFFVEIWQLDHPMAFFFQLWRPYQMKDVNRKFLVRELRRLVEAVETFTGEKISEGALQRSVALYDESRSLMKQLDERRVKNPGCISAADMTKVIAVSMLIPREEFNDLLKDLLAEIPTTAKKTMKVMVAGLLCAAPHEKVLDLIEGGDMAVVADDLYTGGRYYNISARKSGAPIEAIADRYMDMVPCTTYHYPDRWTGEKDRGSVYGEYLVALAQKTGVSGIIILRAMYCDPFDMEFRLMRKKLDEQQIPYQVLVIDQVDSSIESIRTRLEAFEDSLHAMKG